MAGAPTGVSVLLGVDLGDEWVEDARNECLVGRTDSIFGGV
jgi:hypothetical protein